MACICIALVQLWAVFDLSRGWGLFPTGWWRPPTADCKAWSGGRIWPTQKGQKSKSVLKSL